MECALPRSTGNRPKGDLGPCAGSCSYWALLRRGGQQTRPTPPGRTVTCMRLSGNASETAPSRTMARPTPPPRLTCCAGTATPSRAFDPPSRAGRYHAHRPRLRARRRHQQQNRAKPTAFLKLRRRPRAGGAGDLRVTGQRPVRLSVRVASSTSWRRMPRQPELCRRATGRCGFAGRAESPPAAARYQPPSISTHRLSGMAATDATNIVNSLMAPRGARPGADRRHGSRSRRCPVIGRR